MKNPKVQKSVVITVFGLSLLCFQNCSNSMQTALNNATTGSNQGNGGGGGNTGGGPITGINTNPPAGSVYYIRTDGGNQTQCNGQTDAAYTVAVTNKACAWKHPYYAFPPASSSLAVVPGGSTVIIKNGSYQMGINALPTSETGCNTGWPWDCHMRTIPGGTQSQPTQILGEGYSSNCTSKPELWGSERATPMMDLSNANYVNVACLEFTDHSNCIEHHMETAGGDQYTCNRNTYPYGDWTSVGIYAKTAAHILVSNLNFHGLADYGFQVGNVAYWTIDTVNIVGNGWGGFNGDVGDGATDTVSDHNATMLFKNSYIAWNGCTENYPSATIVGCWGQQSGGYGDGLGSASSPNGTFGLWTFQDTTFLHNTQDGLDLLHSSNGIQVNLIRVHSEGNAGNQVKISGTDTVQDSLIIGDCSYHQGKFPNMGSGDVCRASGNALVFNMMDNQPINIKNSTIVGEGDTVLLGVCNQGVCSNNPALLAVNLYNNIVIGYTDYYDNTRSSGYYWYQENYGAGTGSPSTGLATSDKNIVYNVKANYCPTGTNLCNTDPKLVAESDIQNINALLSAGSPAIGAADPTQLTSTDFSHVTRVSPDIGAYEH